MGKIRLGILSEDLEFAVELADRDYLRKEEACKSILSLALGISARYTRPACCSRNTRFQS